MTPQSGYLVARLGVTVYIRALGLANMRNAPMLDSFLASSQAEGAVTACIDLSACSGMDSTFMGLLVGHAKMRTDHGGRLVIVNPSSGNARLLRMLGVDVVVPMVETHALPEIEFLALPSDPSLDVQERMAVIQRAHQNLVRLSDANKAKFSAFLQVLETDLARLGEKPP